MTDTTPLNDWDDTPDSVTACPGKGHPRERDTARCACGARTYPAGGDR